MLRWAGLFLGPGQWASEPYFSNPINNHYTIIKCIGRDDNMD